MGRFKEEYHCEDAVTSSEIVTLYFNKILGGRKIATWSAPQRRNGKLFEFNGIAYQIISTGSHPFHLAPL